MLRKLLDFLVFSNIYIALAALCMYWATLLTIGLDVSYFLSPISLLLFFGTLFIYNLLRIYGLKKINLDQSASLMSWVKINRLLVLLLIIISAVFAILLFLMIPRRIQIIYIAIAIIAMAYAFPLLPLRRSFYRLRELGLLKTFIVALVWMLSTGFVPCLLLFDLSQSETMALCLNRFLFILGITIPFDIRDMKYDEQDQLKTIAHYLGVRKTRLLACFVLFLAAVISVISAWMLHTGKAAPGIGKLLPLEHTSLVSAMTMVSILVAIYIISRLNVNSNEYQYTFILDGTMILQFILILSGLMIYNSLV